VDSINIDRTDLVLQYIAAVAGQETGWDRELGMIHFIKYVYLADLEYSKSHNGTTYTGLPWIFHHFGPWSVDCFNRIEPALKAIGATKRTIASDTYKDFDRWSVDSDELFDRLGNKLDLAVAGAVQKYFRKFGSDTYCILDYVYKTAPMISAAPGEPLDFTHVLSIKNISTDEEIRSDLTPRQIKLRRKKLSEFKERINQRLERKVQENRMKTCPLPPRYDEIFFEGLAQIDAAAASELAGGEYIAEFSDDIWKSKARHDPDLS